MFRVSGRKLIKTLYQFIMTRIFCVVLFFSACFCYKKSAAQFSGPPGTIGTTAMYKDSSAFVAWATQCHIIRGLQDISTPSYSYATVGDSSSAIGIAGTTGVVSLGDSGIAILQFASPISDGSGNDFAVFENSFSDYFLELAFVEVSSDDIHYFRFPAISNFDTTTQVGPFDYSDPTKLNNLAGKYKALYGTPFDLADIADNSLLNKNNITHVKLIDVIGSIQNQYCTRDSNHHKINDPWPTPYNSSGFDLDAVGVIHNQLNTVGLKEQTIISATIYPNPVNEVLHISANSGDAPYSVSITNLIGESIIEFKNLTNNSIIKTDELQSGMYMLKVSSSVGSNAMRFMKL
jgi:hypothetical protein